MIYKMIIILSKIIKCIPIYKYNENKEKAFEIRFLFFNIFNKKY